MENKGLWVSVIVAVLLALIIGAILYGMFIKTQAVSPRTFTY
ncbi:MAG: hypothetical protein WD972_01335 [Candidatus Andersenbacteria bacterium]